MAKTRELMIVGTLAVAGALFYFGLLLLEPERMERWVPTETAAQRALVGVLPLLGGLLLMLLSLPREPTGRVTRLPAPKPLRVALRPPPPRGPAALTRGPASSQETRPTSPREDLLGRLEDVNARLNRAKVQYGLGQLSAQGYQVYVKKLEEERASIEQRLLDAELAGKASAAEPGGNL